MPGKLKIEIRYCHPCDYLPEAASICQDLLREFGLKVVEVRLVPGGGACFEVFVNGELLHSKLQSGDFPTSRGVIAKIRERLRV